MISRKEFDEYVNHKQYDYIEQQKVTNAIILAAGKSKTNRKDETLSCVS